MIYISAQPGTLYYAWQVEVMINNFIKCGINPSNIQILVGITKNIPDEWIKLSTHYNSVKFFFYHINIKGYTYPSIIRPNILKQHFSRFLDLSRRSIFYHDCDIVFTGKVNHGSLNREKTWFLSNTLSYISYDYFKSKGLSDFKLKELCELVGLPFQKLVDNNSSSGGAQYVLKGIDSSYWEKVEKDCQIIYDFFEDVNKNIYGSEDGGIQRFCSDMWSVLWNGWSLGYETKIIPEMNFVWSCDSIDKWNDNPIYHNAGAVPTMKGIFKKYQYVNSLPYDIKLEDYSPDKCSYNYVKEIIETGKRSVLTTSDKQIQ